MYVPEEFIKDLDYETGRKITIGDYNRPQSLLHVEIYEDDEKRHSAKLLIYYLDEDGKEDGYQYCWDMPGRYLLGISHFKNGVSDGYEKSFYPNGMLSQIIFRTNGRIQGNVISFKKDGSFNSISFYDHNGKWLEEKTYQMERCLQKQGRILN